MVSAGMTVVDSGGFSLHYFPPECAEKCRTNVETRVDNVVRVPVPNLVARPDKLPLAAVITRASSLEVQLSRRQAVMSRLPEHLQCVLPDECRQGPCPWLSWRSIKLILMNEVCVADMVTHSIETGFSRPVKPPPQRESCEENDQIERQLSESLLEEEIRVSESPWASPVLCIWQES